MDAFQCGQPGTTEGDHEYTSLAEASRYLQVSPRMIRRWAMSGRIPARAAAAGDWVFRLADLEAVAVRGDGPPDTVS